MTTQSWKTIKLEIADGIAWLYLNRPEKKNAMTPELHAEMDQVLVELEDDPEARVVLIGAVGDGWCAGHDLQKFFREGADNPKTRKRVMEISERWRSVRLTNYDKPTIAMVHGFCFGGGFTQLTSCDFAIAAEDAVFGLSEVNWGVLPGGNVSKALVDMIAFRDALYYAATGESFTGKQAAEMKLINKAVPAAELKAATTKLAKTLMEKNPETLRAIKHCMRAVRTMDYFQSTEYLNAKVAELRMRDKTAGREKATKQFLEDKTYKPGRGAYKDK